MLRTAKVWIIALKPMSTFPLPMISVTSGLESVLSIFVMNRGAYRLGHWAPKGQPGSPLLQSSLTSEPSILEHGMA
jgi:hypothetical protein